MWKAYVNGNEVEIVDFGMETCVCRVLNTPWFENQHGEYTIRVPKERIEVRKCPL